MYADHKRARLLLASAFLIGAPALAFAQVAAGTYVGSVEFQNICSNAGQGDSAGPVRLVVETSGLQNYLFGTTYSGGTTSSGQPITQGGYSLIKLSNNGKWTDQILIYGGGYNGYSTDGGTWSQTFTTSGGVVSGSGTFNIIVSGQVVCSESTSSVFVLAPKGL